MNSKKLTALLLVITVFCLPAHAMAYQMVKKNNKNPTLTFKADLVNNGITEEVSLIRRTPDNEDDVSAMAAINVKMDGKSFLKEAGMINRFETGIDQLSIKSKQKNFIVLSQPIGTSGWRIRLYSFDGSGISEELSAYSDRPSIEVKDVDENDIEVVVLSRDTQSDPEKDDYAITYIYKDNKWQTKNIYRTATKEYVASDKWPNIIKR